MAYGEFGFSQYPDGSIEIRYEDYGTYSGMDYEATYRLDPANAARLRVLLSREAKGSLEDMLREVFGEYLNRRSFAEYLNTNQIKYSLFTWCS